VHNTDKELVFSVLFSGSRVQPPLAAPFLLAEQDILENPFPTSGNSLSEAL